MATITLSEPGTEYGPCVEPCDHTDCAETRSMAARICTYCKEQIGYIVPFYCDTDRQLIHDTCWWNRKEAK